jgi:hypothetical protein
LGAGAIGWAGAAAFAAIGAANAIATALAKAVSAVVAILDISFSSSCGPDPCPADAAGTKIHANDFILAHFVAAGIYRPA